MNLAKGKKRRGGGSKAGWTERKKNSKGGTLRTEDKSASEGDKGGTGGKIGGGREKGGGDPHPKSGPTWKKKKD